MPLLHFHTKKTAPIRRRTTATLTAEATVTFGLLIGRLGGPEGLTKKKSSEINKTIHNSLFTIYISKISFFDSYL